MFPYVILPPRITQYAYDLSARLALLIAFEEIESQRFLSGTHPIRIVAGTKNCTVSIISDNEEYVEIYHTTLLEASY